MLTIHGRFAACAMAFCMLAAAGPVAGEADVHVISATEALKRTRSGDLLLVDVRSPAEWRESGVPEGAARVTIHQPGGPQAFHEAMLEAVAGDRTRPIGLICARGGRSDKARRFLAAVGFATIFDVSEGMLGSAAGPGWLARGLPVRACYDC